MAKRRPKCLVKYGDMDAVKECAERCGSHWFEPGTMRFFKSRVGNQAFTDGRGGAYFVSSEQHSYRGQSDPRRYTVRYYDPGSCSIETIGKFQQYKTGAQATKVARKIAAKSKTRKRGYRMERRETYDIPEGGPARRVVKYRRLRGAK
jgi:hypothetical protein